jgi:uncharacterized membrane protein
MMGRWIMVVGFILIVIGMVLHFAPWLINWIGRLPGDMRIETGRSKIFIPIVSMIVLSILLTLILNIVKR